jgi:hypothetical protein
MDGAMTKIAQEWLKVFGGAVDAKGACVIHVAGRG